MERKANGTAMQARQNKALALSIRGYSPPEIRKMLGYASDHGVRMAIRKAAKRQAAAPVEEARNVERIRLQFLNKLVIAEAISPTEFSDAKVKAVKVAVDISQRMSGLMGLDMQSTDDDSNDVDMWLQHISGAEMYDGVELDEEEEDLEPDDLELDEEEEGME